MKKLICLVCLSLLSACAIGVTPVAFYEGQNRVAISPDSKTACVWVESKFLFIRTNGKMICQNLK
ncbi:MAG: hypothetical protein LBC92_03440 [Rickettsiales bacterium]|jgi:uncharacterized lipoprotein YmbA|nr:hypothetical protein [Rickettsiales bacterium]